MDTDEWPRLARLLLKYHARHTRNAEVTRAPASWESADREHHAEYVHRRRRSIARTKRRPRSVYVNFAREDHRTRTAHRDVNNVGPSRLLGLDGYTGGGLLVRCRRDEPFDVRLEANRARDGSPFFVFDARRERCRAPSRSRAQSA